jgi:hypothetical protein
MWFSPSNGDNPTNSTPFATVALAGHTVGGDWCGCGTQACICEPGDQGGNLSAPTADRSRHSAPARTRSSVDPGAGLLMLAFAFLLWTKLRA